MERSERGGVSSVEELARQLSEIDWEVPSRAQPAIGFVRRRRVGL